MIDDAPRKSRLLSFVLRHRPEAIGIELDEAGWTPVEKLIDALARSGSPIALAELEALVATNDKQRFAINANRTMIRANQGHSVPVELGLTPAEPPHTLFHGTIGRFIAGIRRDGLRPKRRHHVHLHADQQVALAVGARRGTPILLEISSGAMHRDGFEFFCSANHVWLTAHVAPGYIRDLEEF